ncbi:hypothetical protein K502DRAFT_368031 [Neoconidiobolus thromboides FSU 785]|nr:hypothetical protein K502DRAFT_368031 [Neoconidiobolus thromboides FSU 785]
MMRIISYKTQKRDKRSNAIKEDKLNNNNIATKKNYQVRFINDFIEYMPEKTVISTTQFDILKSLMKKQLLQYSVGVHMDNLLSVLQYPNKNSMNKGLKLFKYIMENLNSYQSGFKTNNALANNKVNKDFFNLILRSFRENACKLFNIFYRKKFYFDQLNLKLRLAVLACGLVWLPNTDLVTQSLNKVNHHLGVYFKKPSDIPISFSSLQTITLILTHLRGCTWTYGKRIMLTIIGKRIIGIMGLNRVYNCNYKLSIERKLLYSAFIFNSACSSISQFTSTTLPFKLIKPEYSLNSNISKLSLIDIHCLTDLFLADLFIQLSDSIITLSNIQQLLIIAPEEHINNLNHATKLKEGLNQFLQTIIIKSNKLKLIPNAPSERIDDILMFFKCFFSFIDFYVLSFNFYHYDDLIDNKDPKIKKLVYEALIKCYDTINYFIELKPECLISDTLPFVVRCVIFLIRHLKFDNKRKKDYSNLLRKSIQKISSLSDFPSFNMTIVLNLKTINLVNDFINDS